MAQMNIYPVELSDAEQREFWKEQIPPLLRNVPTIFAGDLEIEGEEPLLVEMVWPFDAFQFTYTVQFDGHTHGCNAYLERQATDILDTFEVESVTKVTVTDEITSAMLLKAKILLTFVCSALRERPRLVYNSRAANLINAPRTKAGHTKPLGVIDLTAPLRVAAEKRERARIGSEKQPHDRRGHTRRLRDGRTIPVRSSKIHGGSKSRRVYLATADE